jgi:hypothetical protein
MTDPEIPTPPGEMFRRTQHRAQQMRRRRRSVLLAAAAAAVAAAVAVPLTVGGGATKLNVVSGSSTTASPSPSSTSVPGRSTAVPSHSSTTPVTVTTLLPSARQPTTTVPTPSSTVAPTIPMCATGQLSGSLTGQNGTAGGVVYTLVLTNRGSSACTLYGYPGASYVDANGNTVGAPAIRSQMTVQTVTLAPGGAAQAPLLETDPLNYPQPACQLTAFTGLRFYPPGQRASLVIPQAGQTCANPADNVLQVQPMQPA